MCAIIGALVKPEWAADGSRLAAINKHIDTLFQFSFERGRDGWGYTSIQHGVGRTERVAGRLDDGPLPNGIEYFKLDSPDAQAANLIANLRAEPTTEYIKDKRDRDQQPYSVGKWSIAHNGTIANDKELRTGEYPSGIDSAAIVETLALLERDGDSLANTFIDSINRLKGSYAILASHVDVPQVLFVAANYRPVWFAVMPYGVLFASSRDYFPKGAVAQMVEPYTASIFTADGRYEVIERLRPPANSKALVVCSGGLDSVVSAAWAQNAGYDITLLHFQYGSRAEGPEVKAVQAVAEALDAPLQLFPLPIYKPEMSPLLRADSTIAGGEAGAEFAHEWVPARNLAMLAIATALAEAGDYNTIILGNNLEEAGAYPDNEPEFIAKFNDLLPFAVGDGKQVHVLMPVGNLMKHEIVKLGWELKAPLDKTWSCYRAGHQHCGTCGPCYMRRTAFEINGLREVITYANESDQS